MNKITLVIEGTYPHIFGGVATWIHQIITKLEEFDFYLIILLPEKKDAKNFYYILPENVKGLYYIFLQEYPGKPLFLPKKIKGKELIEKWLNNFSIESFKEIIKYYYFIKNKKKIIVEGLYSKESFILQKNIYNMLKTKGSFINYFWNVRTLLINILNVFSATPDISKVVHTTSTGFAGLLASILKITHPEIKMLLTEHGIYTKEREFEIFNKCWSKTDNIDIFQELWKNTFSYISKICYLNADKIVTLHENNKNIQIQYGAPPEKILVINNGVDVDKYKFKHRKKVSSPPVVGFLGRIVKIKDVITLIKAANIVISKKPETIFKIAGPYNEDKEYFNECKQLVKVLKLENNIKFYGKVDSVKFYNEIDILILTSISESQPLVILEAGSCGIPCIATNVGCCKELIYGTNRDNLGKSGLIVEHNVKEIASAILKLINNEKFYSTCSYVGRKRVETFYNEKNFIQRYRDIYSTYLK